MVCKLFFSTYVLAVYGFINLRLGTRAFCLKKMDISSKHGTALIFIIVDFEVDFGTYIWCQLPTITIEKYDSKD
jgi:hypothetical protein